MGAVWINCKSLIFIVWGQQGYKLDKDVLFKIMEITSEEQKIQKEMTNMPISVRYDGLDHDPFIFILISTLYVKAWRNNFIIKII